MSPLYSNYGTYIYHHAILQDILSFWNEAPPNTVEEPQSVDGRNKVKKTYINIKFIDTSTITAYFLDTNQKSTLCQSGLSQSWLYALYSTTQYRFAWVNNQQNTTYKKKSTKKKLELNEEFEIIQTKKESRINFATWRASSVSNS